MIDIDSGLMDPRDAVEAHVRKKKLPFPVLWDKDGATSKELYAVRRYPTGYLIGADGKVLWEGEPAQFDWSTGEPVLDMDLIREHEKRIEEALERVDPEKLRPALPFRTTSGG